MIVEHKEISRATLGRLPIYLDYLKTLPGAVTHISATAIAKALHLGEVQVRKDLGSVSGAGRPKVGYSVAELTGCLQRLLSEGSGSAVIVGAGRLGRALLDYSGFADYGLSIVAAFDRALHEPMASTAGKPILPMERLEEYCATHPVKIGVITVPAADAQSVADRLYRNGIRAFWCFAPVRMSLPEDAVAQYENMALSLAHLNMQLQPEHT